MLEELRIQNLGVIDDAVLGLAAGLTVVTGETGAGKTMVVTGLGLLFGARADSGLVRPGTDKALVEGRLLVDDDAPVAARILEAGGDVDDGVLLLARSLSAEGRSRAVVGGRGAPVSLLAELSADLIAVHGQSDQLRLLQPARQLAALDRYAGPEVTSLAAEFTDAHTRYRAVVAQHDELTERARERARELDMLRFGIAEVEAVAPEAGEDTALAAEAARLEHADALRTAAASAHAALRGDPALDTGGDAADLVDAARRTLDQQRDHDPALATLADRLAEVSYLLTDVATDVASYTAGIDADPERLAQVNERRAALGSLTRKYGDTLEAVLSWAASARDRVDELAGDDDRIERLAAERDRLRDRLGAMAGELSRARSAAAEQFGQAVTAELADLAMPQARVSVEVRQRDDAAGLPVDGRRLAFGPSGVDDVTLLLAPHPGAPARPVQRGASGGELSRVMLAVEVVFAGADPVPTFVFDEVDAGVGGSAAVEVGRRLAALARTAQVIVVTHLPQVAAFADHHLRVVKSGDGAVTRSGVVALDTPGRVRELSRMLAGLEGSELAAAHAEELLATAAGLKAQPVGR